MPTLCTKGQWPLQSGRSASSNGRKTGNVLESVWLGVDFVPKFPFCSDVWVQIYLDLHESLNLESVKSLPLCRLESEYSGAILELKSRQMFDRSSSHHQAHHLSEFCRPMLESGFRQTCGFFKRIIRANSASTPKFLWWNVCSFSVFQLVHLLDIFYMLLSVSL